MFRRTPLSLIFGLLIWSASAEFTPKRLQNVYLPKSALMCERGAEENASKKYCNKCNKVATVGSADRVSIQVGGCEPDAEESDIRVADFTATGIEFLKPVTKMTVGPSVTDAANYIIPYFSRLDAEDGYVERILVSREGIEMVHACFLGGEEGGDATTELKTNTGETFDNDSLYNLLFVRPSTLTDPTVASVEDWIGFTTTYNFTYNTGRCEGNNGNSFPNNREAIFEQGNTGYNLTNMACIGSTRLTSVGQVSLNDIGVDGIGLGNEYGGAFISSSNDNGVSGFNWKFGETHVCYLSASVQYRPSGSTYPNVA